MLGSGGFGITYKAMRDADGQIVVLKESLPRSCAYREQGSLMVQPRPGMEGGEPGCFDWAKQNFLNEAITLSSLRHPNIVGIEQAFESDETGATYYVMPLVSEHSLQDYIRKGGAGDRKWTLYLLSCLLGALNYIHGLESPLLHRDIKPENILITKEGRPVLIDFGSSRETVADLKTSLVTHSFSPIEQSKGHGEGAWTDLYSLGATMYYLITGRLVPPLDHRMPREEDAYRPLADMPELEKIYGAALLASIDKALAFYPAERFQSALEWAEALRFEPHFQSHFVVPPPYAPRRTLTGPKPPRVPFSLPPGKKRNNLAWVLLLFLLLFLLLGGGAWYYFGIYEPKPKPHLVVRPLPGPSGGNKEENIGEVAHRQLPQRILAKPGATLYSPDGAEEKGLGKPILALYYVDADFSLNGEEFYRISRRPGEAVCASILKQDTIPWNTSLAMRLTHPGGLIKRDISLNYDHAASAGAYAALPPLKREAIQEAARTYMVPEDFARALQEMSHEGTYGIIGREPLKWSREASSHLLPITAYHKDAEGNEISVSYGGNNKRKSRVYQVAAITRPTDTKVVIPEPQPTDFEGIDVVFVLDTTQSMRPFINGIKDTIADTVRTLDDNADQLPVRYGIIGYRDWHLAGKGADAEKVATVDYVTHNYTEQLLPAQEFLRLLDSVEAADHPTVGYMEDVLAGLHAVVEGDDRGSAPQWRKNTVKCVFLIGDAPGREPGEQEDYDLCRDGKKPRGTLCGCTSETIKAKLREKKIGLSTTFVLTNQQGVSRDDWNDYELKGIERFSNFAYATYPRNDKPLVNFNIFNKTGQAVNEELKAEIDQFGTAAELAAGASEMDETAVSQAFSQKVLLPIISELHAYAENPEKALEKRDSADLTPTQCMFADAYIEMFNAYPHDKSGPGEQQQQQMPVDSLSWMLDKDPNGNSGLESCAILTRRQLEKIVELLEHMLAMMQENQESLNVENWGSVQKLMVVTLADPNLIQDSADLNEMARQFSVTEIDAMRRRFPDRSTSIIHAGDISQMSDQMQEEFLNALRSKLDLLRQLGKEGNWVSDGDSEDGALDFIAVPLDYLP